MTCVWMGLTFPFFFSFLLLISFVAKVALAALRQKKAYEGQLDSIAGTRLTLSAQVSDYWANI